MRETSSTLLGPFRKPSKFSSWGTRNLGSLFSGFFFLYWLRVSPRMLNQDALQVSGQAAIMLQKASGRDTESYRCMSLGAVSTHEIDHHSFRWAQTWANGIQVRHQSIRLPQLLTWTLPIIAPTYTITCDSHTQLGVENVIEAAEVIW